MKLFPDPEETIEGVGRALRAGERTCADVLESCLARIDEWEPRVHAWVIVDREGAREQARRLDEELKAGKCRGPLHGIPIGIKDIIDVAGLPTVAGFPPWSGRVAEQDAYLVKRLRLAGAVILGKTVTTQFAWIDPPVTRNPWNLNRTPGGSSSGSAAAVACGMCLGALGTQTGGSIIRPASFCGVTGFKPSHGRVSDQGILPFAPSLDHPGPIARTVRDLRLLFHEINVGREIEAGDTALDFFDISPLEFADRLPEFDGSVCPEPPCLWRLDGFYDRRADPAMRAAFERAFDALRQSGAYVTSGGHFDFDEIVRKHRTIMAVEAATIHEDRYAKHRDDYQPRIGALIEEGLAVPVTAYARCRLDQKKDAVPWVQVEGRIPDAFVMPATIGPAPGLETTGDPAFNSPWSYLGYPAVSFPIGLSAEGLPLAIQLVSETHGGDLDLLRVAEWCENVIRRQFM